MGSTEEVEGHCLISEEEANNLELKRLNSFSGNINVASSYIQDYFK